MNNATHSNLTLSKLSAIALALFPLFHVQADEFSYPPLLASQSDFGGVGLMQMPTGRMAPEGEFNFATTYNSEYQHFSASVQLFPWFETTVRYTQVQDLLYSDDPSFSGNTKYTDKGIDFKVRLVEESYWLPETSIGIRDFGGTGLFDGEFIAATKRVGPVDFTLGIGWGYIGNSGNLTSDKKDLNDNCNRDTSYGGSGGTVDYQRWFKGCAALYGGIEYQTPWEPLRVKVEYDGNDYLADFPVTGGGVDMSQDSKFNYGLLYRATSWSDFHLSYERGNTWTLGVSLQTNFNDLRQIKRDTPAEKYKPIAAVPMSGKRVTHERTEETAQSSTDTAISTVTNQPLVTPESSKSEQVTNTTINAEMPNQTDWDRVATELSTIAGYDNPKIYLDNHSVTVVADQVKYMDRKEAHHRAATILANNTNKQIITEYRLIETRYKQPITETRIDADKFAQVATYGYINADMADSTEISVPRSPQGTLVTQSHEDWLDKLSFDIAPTMVQSFGGSEGFYMFNIGVTGSAAYRFNDRLELSGSLYLNLYDNYDKFLYDVPPDGTDLKRVRTLIRQYVHDSTVRATNLQLTWMDNLSDNISYQAYGGYLEMMYGGVGTEFLYRPLNSEWAFGFDVNYAKQRDPDSMFGFFEDEHQYDPITGPYRVQTGVVTGHATAYYQPKWFPNTLLKVSAGQYLTEDKGITVDFSKQFDSGVIVGAFATKTNLSAEEYGEGSFTKGFYISIPFDLMTIRPTQSRGFLSWMPLTRDGGQMLGRKYNLFDMTDARSPWYTRPSVDPTK